MALINLRDYYPFYQSDYFVELPDDVVAEIETAERLDRNYLRRLFYNNAHYSLDAGDGIENKALCNSLTLEEQYEKKEVTDRLYLAMNDLPEKQRYRIHAHYIFGINKSEIAKSENVSEKNIRQSIIRALKNLRKVLVKAGVDFDL